MLIRFHKLTADQHELEVFRADGSVERALLETRSFLVHDLAHLAVESEARMADGFWGHVARGVPLAALNDPTMPQLTSLMDAERLAAPFQTLWHGRLPRERYREVTGVSEAFIEGALGRMHRLVGHWKATPYRGFMELRWPLE